jgi:arylsulfatase A-like enzyme
MEMVTVPLKGSGAPNGTNQITALGIVMLSAWCGLAAGWLEVGTRVLLRSITPTNRLFLMSRHFVWLTPAANLLLFVSMGLILALGTWLWPRRGGWVSARILAALAVLPSLMLASSGVYTLAWLILALGIATRVVPLIERPETRLRRRLMWSVPLLMGMVPIVAGLVAGGDRLKQWREASRALPHPDSPNVLLIVLDTVRADHLSLHGYSRPTSPGLGRLAQRGIRFNEARATAPWTLPSHASMFTGRLAHELATEWMTPLKGDFPTLAGYLGAHGYATAGFVGNTLYCSYDTGLDRGFTHYEDYELDLGRLRTLRMALLVDRACAGISSLGLSLYRNFDDGALHTWIEPALRELLARGRKTAGSVNREFLAWLSHRRQSDRPFFAFLNYFDAHSPYLPPEGTEFRFGLTPSTDADFLLLDEFWAVVDKLRLAPRYRTLVQDSYDNCIGYLDEQLGELFDELQQSGVLERTLVIVTADHGEELGDHALFDHGESLYRPEIRVPLLIVLPSSRQFSRVVTETVSLRDLPATVLDQVGLAAGSPFPGRSMARLWSSPSLGEALGEPAPEGAISELAGPNPSLPSQGRSPAARGPLVSLAQGDFVYIRNEGSGAEELFNQREDPHELMNRAGVRSMQPVLERMRRHLDQMRTHSP